MKESNETELSKARRGEVRVIRDGNEGPVESCTFPSGRTDLSNDGIPKLYCKACCDKLKAEYGSDNIGFVAAVSDLDKSVAVLERALIEKDARIDELKSAFHKLNVKEVEGRMSSDARIAELEWELNRPCSCDKCKSKTWEDKNQEFRDAGWIEVSEGRFRHPDYAHVMPIEGLEIDAEGNATLSQQKVHVFKDDPIMVGNGFQSLPPTPPATPNTCSCDSSNTPLVGHVGLKYNVVCVGCSMKLVGGYETKELAVEAWNKEFPKGESSPNPCKCGDYPSLICQDSFSGCKGENLDYFYRCPRCETETGLKKTSREAVRIWNEANPKLDMDK